MARAEEQTSRTAIALQAVAQELQCAVSFEGLMQWAGPSWERDLGLDAAQTVGHQLCDLAHPDDRDRMALELIALRERGHVTSGFQCRMSSATGTARWYRWTGVESEESLVLSGSDVTSVREPDRGREDLVASALDAIVSIDADDRIVEFNPSAEEIFGFDRDDALGRKLTDLIVPPAQRGAHREGVRRVANGAPFHLLGKRLELSALRADGSEFPAELTITQSSTAPFRVTAFVRDLSREHAARKALVESEARYAQAFDQAPVGIALVCIDPAAPGRLLRVNDALSEMTGYPREELLTGTFSDFTHPDDCAENARLFAEVLSGARAGYELEKRFIRKDGSEMWGHVQGTLARDADGQPLYGIGQVQDITVRKAAERELHDKKDQLARTELLARIGAWEWDVERDLLSWSTGLNFVFGRHDADAQPSLEDLMQLIHADDRQGFRRAVEEILAGESPAAWEYRALRSGEVVHMFAWGEVVSGERGALTMRGYAQEVTERRRAEARTEEMRREYELILAAAGEGILRVDDDGLATYVNPAASRLLGYEPPDLIGRPIPGLTGSAGDARRVAEDVLWRRDGTPIPVEYTIAPLPEGEGVAGAVIVFSDITERRAMEERLRAFAELDPLTGLMNRRRFEEFLAEHLTDRRANGALLLLDLDHFKFVNDSFGHAAGDDLLRAIGNVLVGCLRSDDVLARLGGDEFAVLLPTGDEDEAAGTARRLVAAIEGARPSGLQVGASVGVTCFSAGDSANASDLLVSADIALYEAKDRGRGRVEFFTGAPGASLTWVQRIRAALDEGRFELHSQPIIELAGGTATQEELLVRMLGEDGSVIPPAQFLPTAETFRLIGDIDRWVVAEGVKLAATGRCVHINLSGRSIGGHVLLDELSDLIGESGVDPANLVFELTETVAITNMTDARGFVSRLQGLGCRLALDDFGTGFGSFTYLRNLPADYLKIDRDFVCNLPRSEADLRVVRAIAGIAARFGQRTIAEGVEDEETVELLREAGIDYAQGYLLGRPTPA